MNQDKEQLESSRHCGDSPSPSVSKRPSINHGGFSSSEGVSSFYDNKMFSSTSPPTPMNEWRARPEIAESAKDGDIETQALLRELLKRNSDHTEEIQALRKTLFGLTKSVLPKTYSNNRFDYEQKYPRDRHGEELADNARVWLTYLDEADVYDREKVEGWKETVDVLLVFAGLFSGVITTFVSQASQSLQKDYTQVSASLLFQIAQVQLAQFSGTPITAIPISLLTPNSPFRPSTNAFLVNGLWFTSLAISLSTALIAVLTKQWLYYYMSAISGTALNKARIRHFRFQGLELWKVSLIIDLLPILLHLALGIFLTGVIIFLFPLDLRIAWAIVVIAGVTYTLYFISVILPIRYPDCPYTSSLTMYIGNVYYFLSAIFRGLGLMAKDKFRQRILNCRVSYRKKISYWKVIFQERIPFSVWRLPRYLLNPVDRTLRKLVTWLSRTHQHFQGYISTNGFINWREKNINEAIKEGVVSLDCKALYWLFTISSNPSVGRIIAQGISVHPAPAQETTLIFLQLFWASNSSKTNLNDLFHGLCLDLQSGIIYHWDHLQKLSDEDKSQLDEMEYQSYCRIVESICNGDYVQVLKDSLNDDTLKFPLAIWHRFFEEASKDATLVAHILTYAELDPFNWDSDPSRVPTNNTGIVSFGTPEQSKWIFDYLFRCFYKGVEHDYSSKIRSIEIHYLLVVSVYRNLTSDQTIIADEEQRQGSLEKLFQKFHWWLSSKNQDISPNHYLAFHKDILSVDAFWNEPMTNYARWNAVLCLNKIWSLMDADVASRFLFTECPDPTPIIRWCSQDRVDVSVPIVSLLFMPQSRASLLTILSNDPDARSNFSKCLKNIRRCKYERIKGDYVYPSLMTLFKSADPTMPWFVDDDSILVQAWMLLVLHFDAKEFLLVIKSKLNNQLHLENLYAVMLKEVKSEEEETVLQSNHISVDAFSFRQAYRTYLDRLHASLGEFRRITGTAWPKLEPTAENPAFVSGGATRRDDDTEACRRELEPDESEYTGSHSVVNRIKKALGSVWLKTSSHPDK